MRTDANPFNKLDSQFNTLKEWTWVGCYGGYYLTSDALHAAGFEHGFFTRLWHNRGPDALAGYLSAGVSVHRPQQVHGNKVLNASTGNKPVYSLYGTTYFAHDKCHEICSRE